MARMRESGRSRCQSLALDFFPLICFRISV